MLSEKASLAFNIGEVCTINKLVDNFKGINFKGIQTDKYWEQICNILNKFVKERADLNK